MRHIFTYQIFVPNDARVVAQADGYLEELFHAKKFVFTAEEYEYLRFQSGVYDEIDRRFGTIIMECEEDRIEADCIGEALSVITTFDKEAKTEVQIQAMDKLVKAFRCAQERGVFVEFVNGIG